MTPGGTQQAGTPAPSEAPSSASGAGGTPNRRGGRRSRSGAQPQPPSSQPPSDAVPPSEGSEQVGVLKTCCLSAEYCNQRLFKIY